MALPDIVKLLNKEFGKQILYMASDERFKITRIPTGSYTVDYITGGGIAKGRITELYGNYSTGKTRMAIKIMAWVQRHENKPCLYVNVEDTFDERFARKLGLDIDNLVVFRPDVGEDVVNFVYKCLKQDVFGCIVIDSIAALLPSAEAEAAAEKDLMGRAGKLTSSLMRKLNAGNTNGTTIVLLNQIRDKIGVMFGKKETTPGGRAVSFFASQRIELRRGEALKKQQGKDKITIGRAIYVLLEKDKTGTNEQKSGSFHYLFKQTRIDNEQELLDLGRITSILDVNRGIVKYGKQVWQGVEKFKEDVKKDKKLRVRLWKQIMDTNREKDVVSTQRNSKQSVSDSGKNNSGTGKARRS